MDDFSADGKEPVPTKYFPDNDSSIAAMGMHNLDGSFKYTVPNVNHNA